METYVYCGVIGPWQLLLIALIVLLIFGGKKIPELMHGLGKGIGEFKKGMKESEEELKNKKEETSSDNKEKEE